MKPILFNTDMVRAILKGKKTVTRRLLKIPRYVELEEDGTYTLYAEGTAYSNQSMEQIVPYLKKPCNIGDILYVREAWRCYSYDNMNGDMPFGVQYKADGEKNYIEMTDNERYERFENIAVKDTWQPSLFMPKEAARIFLKVTSVSVDKLQNMNGLDVLKEGVNSLVHPKADYFNGNQLDMFGRLWNSTVNKSDIDSYGWDANPYVWVIEFERCEKPVD